MANLVNTATSEGLTVLLADAGETVTFRTLAVTALVNLTPDLSGDDKKTLDFTSREESEIEILTGAVASIPVAGEYITFNGRSHRIEKVYPRGQTYVCRCHVS